ncbi:MAG: hypothetical protein RR135_01890 [Oscillospiraceae bacterium]
MLLKMAVGMPDTDMSGAMGSATDETAGVVATLIGKLPPWGHAIMVTIGIMLAAAVVGIILGKLYASVRYPDPENQTALPPLLRVIFLCALLGCGVWLYLSLTKAEMLPVNGTSVSEGNQMDLPSGEGMGGTTVTPNERPPAAAPTPIGGAVMATRQY